MYRYRIKSTLYSSDKFGPCQVCSKHVSEVFYHSEQRSYELDDLDIKRLDELGQLTQEERDTRISWTTHECKNLFGHEDCLLGARR